jgi:hypothetical protein
MNLKDMREMVGSIIDYDPEVESYQNEVQRIINQIYLEFFCEHPWKFNQKSVDIYTKPDLTSAASITVTADSQQLPDGLITITSATLTATDDRAGQLRREGDVLVLTNSESSQNNGLYIIDKIDVNGTSIQVSKYSTQNRVKWQGSTGADACNIAIQQRYFTLPEDCISILSVGIRNLEEAGVGTNALGHVYGLMRRDDEELNLRDDFTGTPTCWIPYDQPPDTVSRNVRDFIPRAGKDFTVTATSASNSWYAGTYEFAMAYELHGQVGPMSDPVELTLTKDQKPTFDMVDTTKLGFYGLRKRFFMRIKSAIGKGGATFEEKFFRDLSSFIMYPAGPDFIFFQAEDSTTTYSPDHQNTAYPFGNAIDGFMAIPRAKPTLDNRWRIRLHPRPAAQTPMRVRYSFYPGELKDDYDTPQSPIDTHRYIVYRACQELFIKHKNPDMAMYYENKADDELRKCEKRWLTERAIYHIKGGFKSGPQRLRPFRNLTHQVGKDGT